MNPIFDMKTTTLDTICAETSIDPGVPVPTQEHNARNDFFVGGTKSPHAPRTAKAHTRHRRVCAFAVHDGVRLEPFVFARFL